MAATPRYDANDTRTIPQHPDVTGRSVMAVLPDTTSLTPGPDGLFPSELPLLTDIYVDGKGKWRIAPGGQLGSPFGCLTAEEAALELYPPAAQAHVVSVRYEGGDAFLVIDTVPSRPLRAVCVREDGLWVYDPTKSQYVR